MSNHRKTIRTKESYRWTKNKQLRICTRLQRLLSWDLFFNGRTVEEEKQSKPLKKQPTAQIQLKAPIVNMKRKAASANLEEQEEEEEKQSLFINNCKVIEYLEPFMSKELLFKFPDNSAFDFDYSQSSIWSPLVPRLHRPMDLDLDMITPRKLAFGFGIQSDNCDDNDKKKIRNGSVKISSTKKQNLKLKKKTKISKLVKAPEFSPTPIKGDCVPFASKGWKKILKAASKHFKKKKKDPTVHVKLSNYLTDFSS